MTKHGKGVVIELNIEGREYVIVPKADYLQMRGLPPGTVDALEYGMKSLGRSLREAREHAGLTQAELAKKLKKSQPLISGAESGTVKVGERYVLAVLKACNLPKDWSAKTRAKSG